ncbi:hypothetical protein NDU88_004686 [Pleurodeles waltl]|uniref:Uncharacterized protein n=1 Tax=Pleurodeles waltl TaxID=8319 RepID=A0AAV7L1N5_PLEWA|nr:hypothetical protein NDU88_004686 [Pleurodeles waltl]
MVTFLKKYAKDPKKGIDRAWRGSQEKLLDISGPLTKILDLAIHAKESQEAVDPEVLLEWAQHARECRKSLLLGTDPKLTELVPADAGPSANRLLFGDRFVKDLAKYVATFAALAKAQTSIKKVFNSGLFSQSRAFWRSNVMPVQSSDLQTILQRQRFLKLPNKHQLLHGEKS